MPPALAVPDRSKNITEFGWRAGSGVEKPVVEV
jgi:hypothetical protein